MASVTPEMNRFGTRLGMAFSAMSFGALTGPPIGGALQSDENGSFLRPQLWAAVSTLIGLTLVLTTRYFKGGVKPDEKC